MTDGEIVDYFKYCMVKSFRSLQSLGILYSHPNFQSNNIPIGAYREKCFTLYSSNEIYLLNEMWGRYLNSDCIAKACWWEAQHVFQTDISFPEPISEVKITFKKITEMPEIKSFPCRFCMYIKYRGTGIKSAIHGVDIIDAIKKRNQSAMLSWVQDEDGTEYILNEHEQEDASGYYNHYWTNIETGELLYDENKEVKPPLVVNASPMGETKTDSGWIAPDGKFYECDFEGHQYEAEKIIKVGVVPKATKEEEKEMSHRGDAERLLEMRKWVKLSSGKIRYSLSRDEQMTKAQKETVLDYCIAKNKEHIRVWDDSLTLQDFMSDDF